MLTSHSTAPPRITPASLTLDRPALGPLILDNRWLVVNQVEKFWHWSRQLADSKNREEFRRPEVSHLVF